MVDQRTLNPRVGGSSPSSRTIRVNRMRFIRRNVSKITRDPGLWSYGGMADTAYLKFAGRKLMGVRVPLRLPAMKNETTSPRNLIVVAMNKRHKSGEMRPKKDKRQSGKNRQRELLKEVD